MRRQGSDQDKDAATMPGLSPRIRASQAATSTISPSPWRSLDPAILSANALSISIYGDGEPDEDLDALKESISEQGILVPLVVTPLPGLGRWEILSGHRRWACARALGLAEVPCEVRFVASERERQQLVLEYNRQRRKSFSQMMKEADLLEEIHAEQARRRRLGNLRQGSLKICSDSQGGAHPERRNSDARPSGSAEPGPDQERPGRPGRTDAAIAQQVGIGGKDLYRQARAIWQMAHQGDIRARSSVAQLDAGMKTIHAAYKDLRRRNRFAAAFQPSPYDVWAFRHDRAYGIPHPGAIPPAIVAHTLHYFSAPGSLVVDPMAGGGTTVDVCQAMGRRCLAYDLHPARPDIRNHDIRTGFPPETAGCDLIFCDPPYHTMLSEVYAGQCVAQLPLHDWMRFLQSLVRHAHATLRPGGYLALLLASQTEKDLPPAHGYIDHAFLGYAAALRAGFAPERRISCPMSGAYLPQQVRQARREGRLLGQVRDLLILQKPFLRPGDAEGIIPFTQYILSGGETSHRL
jgi:hypothetical protein